ncbi:MAG TPA: glutamine synthetase family protein [Aggregatilineaceae bacterium]|nr:glutamine synthetase family protein [Aggregatilineaceae bacterium]
MPDSPTTRTVRAEDVIRQIRDRDIRSIDLQFTDVTGMIKTVSIDAEYLPTALGEGIWFDGSAVEGFARIAESDMYLMPDLSTFALMPWEDSHPDTGRTARLLCDVFTPNRQPFAGDPRGALKRVMQWADEIGARYVIAPELEFYLFQQTPNHQPLSSDDYASYFDASDSTARLIRKRVCDALRIMGIPVESTHHEVGGGQHELDFAPMDALQTADAIITARLAVRTIAQQEGRFATFMPKPLTEAPGSGMHLHQWLRDIESENNRFADQTDDYGMSAEAKMFLAGQLTHAREICAVIAPLVNSYKRLVAGLEAPIHVTWAQLNRRALLRVPRLTDGNSLGTRIEMRATDPSCNPYLALAVLLYAGLRGIRDGLALPLAAEEELYELSNRRRHLTTLPLALNEALDEFEGSELVREALGLHLFERFLEAKRLEWQEYLHVVSPWEVNRYINLY